MQKENIYYFNSSCRALKFLPHMTNDLYLSGCGIEYCRATQKAGPMSRPHYHVHFILSGSGYLETGGTLYTLKRGQIFVLRPDVEAYYHANPDDPWYYCWFEFDGFNAASYMEMAGLGEGTYVRDLCENPDVFLGFINQLLTPPNLTIVNELRRISILYKIIAELINCYQLGLSTSGALMQPDTTRIYVSQAIEFITLNYASVKINDIANYLGLNRSHLTRIFKNILNVSPQEYLINYRLEKGCQLLLNTNLAIQEIANKIGYEDPLAFSKMFRLRYGVSPKNFRAHNRRSHSMGPVPK